MSRRLTEINLEASHHSKSAAESAAKSSAAAEDTSRATRVNVQVCNSPWFGKACSQTLAFRANYIVRNRSAVLLFRAFAFCF